MPFGIHLFQSVAESEDDEERLGEPEGMKRRRKFRDAESYFLFDSDSRLRLPNLFDSDLQTYSTLTRLRFHNLFDSDPRLRLSEFFDS